MKKLQIWKLPPILIIHLKRFNFVNNKWVKSQKVVNFPFKNFDPTPYLASVPQETILRHKELIEHGNINVNTNPSTLTNGFLNVSNSNLENDISLSEMTPEHSIMSYSIKEVDTIDVESTADDMNTDEITTKPDEILKENHIELNSSNSQTNNINKLNNLDNKTEQSPSSKPSTHSSRRANTTNASIKMRKRLVSTSLTKSPVIDGAFEDYHQHHLNEGQDSFDMKYKLYAVVVRNAHFFPIRKSFY